MSGLPLIGPQQIADVPANARHSGYMTKAYAAALDSARAAGIVVAGYPRRLFGLAGDTTYVNATTSYTAFGNLVAVGPGGDLPAIPSGATRRHRWAVSYQYNGAAATDIVGMTGGAPGVGTQRFQIALVNSAPPAANVVRAAYSVVAGTPYTGSDVTLYARALSAGSTLRIWAIDLVVEDYIA